MSNGTPHAPHEHSEPHETAAAVRDAVVAPAEYGLRQISGWLLGPGLLLLTLLTDPPEGLSVEGWRTAGAAALMAVWWVTETAPIPVTALLPLVLFPLLGLASIKDAAAPYANPLVFLFLGGFIIALAMQRWNLHRRIALNLIGWMGSRPSSIVLGFMLASAFLSMWVSNTATALMMFPIGLSVVQLLRTQKAAATRAELEFPAVLMLAIAYSATTGGMATLIGTPPNALLAGFLSQTYGYEIGFGQWMLLGVPVVLVGLPIVYFMLTRVSFQVGRDELPGVSSLIGGERAKLGSMAFPELTVAIVFTLTALAWVTQPLLARGAPMLSDTVIAMAGALLLFLIPLPQRPVTFVMDWQTARGVPWDVLILFGGGLSLAAMIEKHGLSRYLGELFGGLGHWPALLTLAVLCFTVLMLTELTSNTATAAALLPVMGALAVGLGENPLLFLIPTALAANCSFMMPVGTPPNAVVFGSGMVTLPQMARTGFWINVVFVLLLVGAVTLLAPLIFGIESGVAPDWAQK